MKYILFLLLLVVTLSCQNNNHNKSESLVNENKEIRKEILFNGKPIENSETIAEIKNLLNIKGYSLVNDSTAINYDFQCTGGDGQYMGYILLKNCNARMLHFRKDYPIESNMFPKFIVHEFCFDNGNLLKENLKDLELVVNHKFKDYGYLISKSNR